MSSDRGKRIVVVCVLVVVWCCVWCGVVWGFRGHERVAGGVFGVSGSGVLELDEPVGVAVDEGSGVVYVVDRAGGRVEVFDGVAGDIGELVGRGLASGEFDGSGLLGEGVEAGGGGLAGEVVTGRFVDPSGVAVDNGCRDHRPEPLSGAACEAFDPSNGDVYVLDSGHEVVDKYTALGRYVGQINAGTLGVEEHVRLEGVAVEGDGDVLVSTQTTVEALRTSEEGVFRLSDGVRNVVLGSGVPTGFTAAAQLGFVEGGLGAAGGRVFVPQGFAEKDVAVYSLAGGFVEELGTGHVVGLVGEVCTGDVYVDVREAGVVRRFGVGGGLVEELVAGGGGGVGVDCVGSGGTVFVALPSGGVVAVYGPEAPKAPLVSGLAVSGVTAGSVRFSAEVDPRSEVGEAATEFVVEYGLCPAVGSCEGVGFEQERSLTGSVGAVFEGVVVSREVSGLVAGGRYHFRVGARNSHSVGGLSGEYSYGVGEDAERVFVMEGLSSGGGAGLLDGRGWELVSPVDKNGALVLPVLETGLIEAAAGGGAFTYLASTATEAGALGNSNKMQVLARRGSGGWASCDVGLPNGEATGVSVGQGQEYQGFSADLGTGLARPLGRVVRGLVGGEREVSPLLVGFSGACGAGGLSYDALLSGCPLTGECEAVVREHADVEPGIEVAEEGLCAHEVPFCDGEPLAANESLSGVVLRSMTPLVAGAPVEALYEPYGGRVYPVSVRPNGTVVGTVAHEPVAGTQAHGNALRGVVSADGSRVVWSEEVPNGHLFVWDRGLERSVQVDVVQAGGSGTGPVGAVFQYMTGDGSRVFFTDTQQLTAGSGAENDSPDLYVCEVVVEGSSGKCVVRDLTPMVGGQHADVLGQVIGGSESGGLVYFVANGELTKTPSASGEEPVAGGCGLESSPGKLCDLYVWSEGAAEPVLVGVLSGEDVDDWGGGSEQLTNLTGRVAGGGEWLVFMSDRSLTGYDTRDAVVSGVRDEEVYEYRFGGGLVCVSCDPSGERPHGVEYAKLNEGAAAGTGVWPEGARLAGFVPSWTPYRKQGAFYQSRFLGGSGRVFFDSSDGLVAGDSDGVVDVYEFEPVGVGSCRVGGVGFVAVDDGCLGLVSSGESGQESGFLDASESGDEVFFLTTSRLSGRDRDTAYDVYDARVGGGEPVLSGVGVCGGGFCQEPAGEPSAPVAGSEGFEGPGSPLVEAIVPPVKVLTRAQKLKAALKACGRDRVKRKRVVCERGARRRYGPVKKKKGVRGASVVRVGGRG